MLSHLASHLQHLLQVAGKLHVRLPSSHGEEAERHFQRGQGLAHLAVGVQLPSHREEGKGLQGLLIGLQEVM